jgi:hypothetical protein
MDSKEFCKLSKEAKIDLLTDGLEKSLDNLSYEQRHALATRMVNIEDETRIDKDTAFVIIYPSIAMNPSLIPHLSDLKAMIDIAYRIGKIDAKVAMSAVGVVGVN